MCDDVFGIIKDIVLAERDRNLLKMICRWFGFVVVTDTVHDERTRYNGLYMKNKLIEILMNKELNIPYHYCDYCVFSRGLVLRC